MFIAKWVEGASSNFEDVLFIRGKIKDQQACCFVRSMKVDDQKQHGIYVVVYEKQQPVAMAQLIRLEHVWQINDLCVLTGYLNQGYEDLMLRMLCDKAMQSSSNELICCEVSSELISICERIGFIAQENARENQEYKAMVLNPINFLKPCQQEKDV